MSEVEATIEESTPVPAHGIAFAEAVRVWARVAALSFGGPAGQIAVMHRILVEEKRWIGEARFLHALNFCTLLPGPEAQQLATYLGWLLHRTRGGLVAGTLFVLPGVVAILALSWLYVGLGDVPLVQALFFGLKAAVLAIVLEAVLRIGRRALASGAMMAIAVAAFVGIFVLGIAFPWIVLAAGIVGFAGARTGMPTFLVGGRSGEAELALGDTLPDHARPNLAGTLRVSLVCAACWLLPVAALVALLGGDHVFSQIAVFFSQMAVVTFGGAYAALAYVAQEAVATYGWLQPGEMLDGLGLAETTPGPLIMVVQFVGFLAAFRHASGLPPLLAGTLGGLLATWVTFAPCFLWIFLGAPFIEALRGNKALAGALAAITAAVVGVILNLAVWFALHTLFAETRPLFLALEVPVLASVDPAAMLLTLAAVVAVFRFRLGMVPTLLGCAAAGLTLHLAGCVA